MSDYYPYSSLIDAGSWSGSTYNFGYNGMLKEGIGKDVYHTQFRTLSDDRWMSPDPLEYMFPGQSPYISMNNNPILMIDMNGDSAFVFDTDGKYIESIDDGKKDWSIQVTDGKNTQYYQINNPEEDVNTIKNTVSQEYYKDKKIIEIVDTEKEDELINSKTKDYENSLISKNFYVLSESLNFSGKEKIGKLDFSKELLNNKKGNQPLLYLNPEHKVAYNVFEYGNFLWGRSIGRMDIPMSYMKMGADINHIKDKIQLEYGNGWLDYNSWLDDPFDQKAYIRGWYKEFEQRKK